MPTTKKETRPLVQTVWLYRRASQSFGAVGTSAAKVEEYLKKKSGASIGLRDWPSLNGVEHRARPNDGDQENPQRVRPHERARNRSNVPHFRKRRQDTSDAYEKGNQSRNSNGYFLHFDLT